MEPGDVPAKSDGIRRGRKEEEEGEKQRMRKRGRESGTLRTEMKRERGRESGRGRERDERRNVREKDRNAGGRMERVEASRLGKKAEVPPWQPATNCRWPRLRAARYSR